MKPCLEIRLKNGETLRYNRSNYCLVVSSDGVLTVRKPDSRSSVLVINKDLWETAIDTGVTVL